MIGALTMHPIRTMLALSLLGLGTLACGDDLPSPPGMAESTSTTGTGSTGVATWPPMGTSTGIASSEEGGGSSSTTGHTTVGVPDECQITMDCPAGELCVAPFDQSAGPEGKGALACVAECVAIMDEDRWCADAAACCDPTAECTDRGYCVYPGDTDTDGSSSGGTGTTGTGTTG